MPLGSACGALACAGDIGRRVGESAMVIVLARGVELGKDATWSVALGATDADGCRGPGDPIRTAPAAGEQCRDQQQQAETAGRALARLALSHARNPSLLVAPRHRFFALSPGQVSIARLRIGGRNLGARLNSADRAPAECGLGHSVSRKDGKSQS